MIGISISGGLGNQLFEYAFIYNQHKRLGASFFLVKSGAPLALTRYFELEKNTFYYIDRYFFDIEGFRLSFSHYLRAVFYKFIVRHFIKQHLAVDNLEKPAEVLAQIDDGVLYSGYFQSEEYFSEHRKTLLRVLKLRPELVRFFNSRFSWLKEKTRLIVVHIRRTDYRNALGYLNLGDDLSLPLSYYHNIIAEIHREDNYYVFISDEIETVADEFNYLDHKYCSSEKEIIDFQLMMQADVCIIANSTFSWWAAYLNPNAGKVVYCPKHFLGFRVGKDYPQAIYPASWIQTEVFS